jgi:hypothetical protein
MGQKKKGQKIIKDKVGNMKKINNFIGGYWKPTPKKWRRVGDSLLAAASVLAIGGLWQFDNLKDIFTPTEIKGMIVASIILGVLGKFLTNFFKEDGSEND